MDFRGQLLGVDRRDRSAGGGHRRIEENGRLQLPGIYAEVLCYPAYPERPAIRVLTRGQVVGKDTIEPAM